MKHLKRIAGLALVLVMLVCMAVPVFAVNTAETPNQTAHTITINNAKDGHEYEAYQIFRGDISDGKLVNVTWGTGVDATKTNALVAELKSNETLKTAMAGADFIHLSEAEAIAEVVCAFGDNSEDLDAFAEVVGKYLSDTKVSNKASEPYNEINVTGDGYYLLKDKNGSVSGNDAYTKYILKISDDTSVTTKTDYPTLEKTFSDGTDRKSGSIGQTVNYTVTSTVPNMDGYNKYFFIVHDTLDAGLTFNNDVKIALTKGDVTLNLVEDSASENHDYAVNVNGQSFEVVLRDFIQYKTAYTGATITITYSATINENAVMTNEGNKNTAWLEFSNDPNFTYAGTPEDTDQPTDDEPTGETPNSMVTVYTTGIKLHKISDGTPAEVLTGAKFSIAGDSAMAYKINGKVYLKASDGAYYRLKDGTYTTTAPTDATAKDYDSTTDKYTLVNGVTRGTKDETGMVKEGWVDTNGNITFAGLGAGTYTITELIAPTGYNVLKAPITITIGFDWDGENKVPVWTVTKDGETLDDVTVENNYISFDVTNKAGMVLPATGGIGTTIFYVLGGVLAVGALVALVTRRRMRGED